MKIRPGYINLVSNPGGGFTFPTGQILAPDGTVSLPSYSFSSDQDTGLYWITSNSIGIACGGVQQVYLDGGGFSVRAHPSAGTAYRIGATAAAPDVILARDAAATLALRNNAIAQTLRVYQSYTDASNGNWLELGVWSSNLALIRPNNNGTGPTRHLRLESPPGAQIQLFPTGSGSTYNFTDTALTISNDNVIDIGATASGRPKSLYLASRIVAGKATIPYSASMTPNAGTGNYHVVTATNGTAFTINAPQNAVSGQFITITLRNASGGALGAATWDAIFKMAAWTNPANGNSRSITFVYDGTNWIEISRTTADVPN